MKVLALFNIKGGVGKTASAINFAFLAAREGRRTLLWDLDPQGASTFTFRIATKVRGGGDRLVSDGSALDAAIRGSDFERLDVLPSDVSYRDLGAALASDGDAGERLRALVAPLADDYDLLVLDCAPGLSTLSEAVFATADALLVPTIPTTFSLRTLAQLMKQLKHRPRRPLTLPFFTLVDRRKAQHRSVCDWVDAQGLGFLRASIPYSALVELMGRERAPLLVYAPGSPPGLAYVELWREIQGRIELGEAGSLAWSRPARDSIEQLIRPRAVRPTNGEAR